ncbi:hypothetical protein B0H13DRAFT_2289273 [Mycena leptocephala]|nr:hypothetical protein B0H13DRAFT_2289273 [Mycena leptocephala]
MYGHITKTVAESVKAGIEEAGGSATLYHAPLPLRTESQEPSPRKSSPRCTPCQARLSHHHARRAQEYNAFLMGVPTRFGNFPAQWKALGLHSSLWSTGALAGKYAGTFTSTVGPSRGQEVTILNPIRWVSLFHPFIQVHNIAMELRANVGIHTTRSHTTASSMSCSAHRDGGGAQRVAMRRRHLRRRRRFAPPHYARAGGGADTGGGVLWGC